MVPELSLSGTSHVHPAKSSPQLNDLLTHFDRTNLSTGGTLANSLKWRGSVGNCMQANSNLPMKFAGSMKEIPSAKSSSSSGVTKLGPGQIQPKGCRLNTPGRYGELKIGFLLQKGVLEIEVSGSGSLTKKH